MEIIDVATLQAGLETSSDRPPRSTEVNQYTGIRYDRSFALQVTVVIEEAERLIGQLYHRGLILHLVLNKM